MSRWGCAWIVGGLALCACSSATEHATPADGGTTPRSDASETPSQPQIFDAFEWANGECAIRMRGPALVATQGEGTEFCIAKFEDADCRYRVEYGAGVTNTFENTLASQVSTQPVIIDMAPAELVTWNGSLSSGGFLTGVYLPSLERDPPDYALNATARCDTREALETAGLVLQTLDLLHVGEGPCEPVRPEKCSPL